MANTKKKTCSVETRPTVKKLLRQCNTVNEEGAISKKKTRGRPKKHHPLSKLSSDVVQDIMSRLPLRDAVRASAALSEWKRMWTAHPNLIFNNRTMFNSWDKSTGARNFNYEENRDKFIARVDDVLQRHNGMGVNRFEIRFSLNKEHAQYLDRWIGFAASAQAREVVFNLGRRPRKKPLLNNDCYFPCDLFNDRKNGSHIKFLKLVSLSLELTPAFSGFANLKTLELAYVQLDLKNLEYLLSKCCLLESLTIFYFLKLVNLSISHPLCRLQHLHIEDPSRLLQNVEFHVTNLTTFVYKGPTIPIVLAGSSKQIDADITPLRLGHYDTLDYVMSELPNGLQHVSSLRVKINIDNKVQEMPNHGGKFRHLTNLKLFIITGSNMDGIGLVRLACLFEVAPFMEKLEMKIWSCTRDPYTTPDPEIDDSIIPARPQNHLKTVCMTGFSGLKGEIQLAIFFLGNATALEKMVIDHRLGFKEELKTADEISKCYSLAHEFISPRDLRKVLTFMS